MSDQGSNHCTDNIPKLEDARGKILIVNWYNHGTTPGMKIRIGEDYLDDPAPWRSQDVSEISESDAARTGKWNIAKSFMTRTIIHDLSEPYAMYFNFLSAYSRDPFRGGIPPETMAWNDGRKSEGGMNGMLIDH